MLKLGTVCQITRFSLTGRGARPAFDTCPDIDADECLRHSP